MRPGRPLRAREIWIDDALCRAPGCRRVTLRQRRVAAFVIVGPTAVYVQANRISRIVRLGPSRCCRQNRRDRQNRQSRNAHQSLRRDMRALTHRSRPKCLSHCALRSGLGRIFRSQTDRPFCSQSIRVRALGRAQYHLGGSNVRHCTNTSSGPCMSNISPHGHFRIRCAGLPGP
jgi:hypothetical protein